MSEHAELSPSGAYRWMVCPGSITLCRGMPDDSSYVAREGTFAHYVAALALKRGCDAEKLIGESDGELTCDVDMALHLQGYLDAVRELKPVWSRIEGKVQLKETAPEIWGTADALLVDKEGVLHCFDLKYGAGVFVDVEDNPQALIYGQAALETFPAALADVETIVAHIYQPRHWRGGHSSSSYTREELEDWIRDVLWPAAMVATSPEAPLHAGDHCQFCVANALCPELRRTALVTVKHLFEDETMRQPAKTPPPPETLNETDLAVALRAFPTIEKWMKAVREYAYDQANRGKEIPGFKLVDRMGNRRWRDEQEAAEAIEFFLPEGKTPYAPPKLLSPAQCEKLVKKKDAPALHALIDDLTIRPCTGTSLVPESDERSELNHADVFDALPEPKSKKDES